MKYLMVVCMRQMFALLFVLSSIFLIKPVSANESVNSYFDLSLEDLLSVEVTSASKKKQRLNEVASAVYVITNADIRRSGVTSIPEALRLAPGINVARLDANKWAITSRGFNNQFANKLLVLIDGRSVYTPVFSGVYWDVQDTMLEDIDRIEVIRGPGASLWGANAVNGVINIITKPASETQGGMLVAGAGNEEKALVGLRFGSELNASTHGRYYLKFKSSDSFYAPILDEQAGDDWDKIQAGFRFDGQAADTDRWTFQGDVYESDVNQRVDQWKDPSDPANIVFAPTFLSPSSNDEVDVTGWNLLSRWDHIYSNRSSSSLQIYYDHTNRKGVILGQEIDTLDIDFNHRIQFNESHDFLWGLGYRWIDADFSNTFNVMLLDENRAVDIISAFLQDEITLLPGRLLFTLGSKFEHNDFTGFEIQPSARLAWLLSENSTLWGSVSRAVRTPSYAEDDSRVVINIIGPAVFYTNGRDDVVSEELLAYEIGYRIKPKDNISFELAVFYNEYENLQSIANSPSPTNLVFGNQLEANAYGLEWVIDWRPLEWWQLSANYSYLRIDGKPDESLLFNQNEVIEDASPNHQFTLRSSMDLRHRISLDFWLYYVDALETSSILTQLGVPEYTSFNAHLAWQANENLEVSVVGQNLLDDRHREYIGAQNLTQTEVERTIYAKVLWEF
ncbi:MAG: TonB-dependent receptor [Candidatus Thiodiazotropha sp.]